MIDVFTAAGLPRPDISILAEQFLAEVRGLKHKNVAAELLEKLLKDELKVALEAQPGAVAAFQREAEEDPQRLPQPRHRHAGGDRGTDQAGQGNERGDKRGQDLGLTDDEVAFYDALAANGSAVKQWATTS